MFCLSGVAILVLITDLWTYISYSVADRKFVTRGRTKWGRLWRQTDPDSKSTIDKKVIMNISMITRMNDDNILHLVTRTARIRVWILKLLEMRHDLNHWLTLNQLWPLYEKAWYVRMPQWIYVLGRILRAKNVCECFEVYSKHVCSGAKIFVLTHYTCTSTRVVNKLSIFNLHTCSVVLHLPLLSVSSR